MKTPTRAGLKSVQKDLELVRNLRDMVERKESGSITTKNVYEDDPWRLNHVKNDLSKKNEWYYFVQRTKRGAKTVKRTVPGRGESEGGTWKSSGKFKEIVDENNNKVHGYKHSLVYNKKVMGKVVQTNWLMTEYTLHRDNDEFQDLVLCKIREKKDKEVENNIVLPNQEQQEAGSGNEIERSIMEQQAERDTTALPPQNNDMMMHSSPQEKDAPIPRPGSLMLTEEERYWLRVCLDSNGTAGFHELMQVLDRQQDSVTNTTSSRSMSTCGSR